MPESFDECEKIMKRYTNDKSNLTLTTHEEAGNNQGYYQLSWQAVQD
jgi:hypothetical protein